MCCRLWNKYGMLCSLFVGRVTIDETAFYVRVCLWHCVTVLLLRWLLRYSPMKLSVAFVVDELAFRDSAACLDFMTQHGVVLLPDGNHIDCKQSVAAVLAQWCCRLIRGLCYNQLSCNSVSRALKNDPYHASTFVWLFCVLLRVWSKVCCSGHADLSLRSLAGLDGSTSVKLLVVPVIRPCWIWI